MNNLITTIAVVFLLIDFSFAQKQEPVIVSPIIGEKLDRVEEDYFRLIPAITNVQEAVFYLNPDSTLNVLVTYEDNGAIIDTLIFKYISLLRLREYINYILTQESNDAQNIKRGIYAIVSTKNDSIVTGELLSVNSTSVTLLNLDSLEYKQLNIPPFKVSEFQDTEINKLNTIRETNNAKFIYPFVLSIGLGLTAGLITKNNTEDEMTDLSEGINLNLTPILYAMLGGLVGGLIGYGLSYIFPIISISETEFDIPFNEDDIIGLRNLSRYK